MIPMHVRQRLLKCTAPLGRSCVHTTKSHRTEAPLRPGTLGSALVVVLVHLVESGVDRYQPPLAGRGHLLQLLDSVQSRDPVRRSAGVEAHAHEVDLGGATTKADMLAAIAAANEKE